MTNHMFQCPKCRERFDIEELVNEWGYDVGDFFDITPEPDWMGWDNFFKLHNEEVENTIIDYGYPVGQVGV